MPLAAGSRLGPFEIVAPLGAGGMGEVYRARDTRLGRDVAIKVLPEEFAQDGDRLRRFQQEARSIAALNHPHICQLHDVGPGYLVLEYVDGAVPRGPIAVDDALRLARQIASALGAAHERGILHRDLKPSNVLVTRASASSEPAVKLLDFGIAKLMADADGYEQETRTSEGAIVGTLAYMSPEQAEGRPIDARSDIFSFGTLMYELLSGRRPFAGATPSQVLSALLRGEPPALDTSPGVERVVRKCLALRPADRFQSMAEVRAALDAAASPADRAPSIAVLPFVNMSRDADDEYFSDGLAEEIINALAQIAGLKVIARTSAFAFKGQNVDVRRIADALDVTSVLEGSVRKAGNRIRVTAQLIAAADGSHLWSQRYDRELEDVFAVQDEIAVAIAGALEVKLARRPRAHVPDMAAYEAYLKGRHYWAKLTPEALAQSRACFERAVAIDPQFAAAHSDLGEHFFALAANGIVPAPEAIPLARKGLLAALEVDPALPEAHALLGAIAFHHDYDADEAARRFRSALALEPTPPRIRWMYGQYLHSFGRIGEAVEQLELALRGDPLHLLCRAHLSSVLHEAGRHEEGVAQIGSVLEIDPDYGVANWYLAVFHVLDGRVAEARVPAERAHDLRPWDTLSKGLRAGIVAREGDTARATSLLAELQHNGYGTAVGRALYHLVRLENDRCAEAMIQAIGERDPRVQVLVPFVRPTPQWPILARMMNLPER